MKKKSLEDIKHGERVYNVVSAPCTFNDVVTKSSLDKLTTQKVLATLQKHGYVTKDSRDLWVAIGESYAQETRVG